MFGTSESFVPIHDASIVEDHLEVPCAKNQVKDAPNVDVDAGGHLSEQEEHRLYEYYGIDWDAAWHQAAQPTADTAQSRTADDAMTRSEEETHVGTERREAGRVRPRKYVVTEERQQTIPVRHEELRIEREPITDENRDAALSNPEISEAEHEVILRAGCNRLRRRGSGGRAQSRSPGGRTGSGPCAPTGRQRREAFKHRGQAEVRQLIHRCCESGVVQFLDSRGLGHAASPLRGRAVIPLPRALPQQAAERCPRVPSPALEPQASRASFVASVRP